MLESIAKLWLLDIVATGSQRQHSAHVNQIAKTVSTDIHFDTCPG